MKKKLLIALGIFALAIVLAFGGIIFYVSKVITPEEIKKFATDGIESALPAAEVKIGKIDLGFGTSVNLDISNLKLRLKSKRNGRDLLDVKSASVSIPFWAILTGGGTVDVKLFSPNINFREIGKTNNWALASKGKRKKKSNSAPLASGKEKRSKKKSVKSKSSKLAIPALATRISLDLTLKQLGLKYRLKDGNKGVIAIDKLLVKNLGLKSSTAFELRSSIKVNIPDSGDLNLNALLIGEMRLQDLLDKDELQSILMLKLSDINYTGAKLSIPNIKTNLNATIGVSGDVSGGFETTFETSKISSDFFLKGSVIKISKMDISLLIADLIKIGNQSIPDLAPGKSRLNLLGNIDLKGGRISPTLKLDLTPGMVFSANGIDTAVRLNGNYNGKKVHAIAALDMLGGTSSLDFTGHFDINSKKVDLAKLRPFIAKVKISNLNLKEQLIRNALYSKKKQAPVKKSSPAVAEKSKGESKPQQFTVPQIILPKGKVTLDLVNIKVGDRALNGKGRININNRSIVTHGINLNYSGGKCKITHKTAFSANNIATRFNLGMQSFNLLGIRPFLPPFIEAVSGFFSGTVAGRVNLGKALNYKVTTNIRAKDGKIEGLKLGSLIEEFAGKVAKGKAVKVPSEKLANFQEAQLKGVFTDKVYTVKKLLFVAINNIVKIKGKGKVYPPPHLKKEGKLFLTYRDSQYLSKYVSGITGSKDIPILIKGYGFDLHPDYQYTTKKLAKKAGKKALSKGKKKAKKYLKKNGKKQVKKLLKSFGF
ncbi:MAG: hypothetical protein KAG61_05975 [Bacteriovoracaceae bacterium]|nr:hypothetical protein [Bacteriovoracaceae bacterium]